jgi:signal transduction histidine kinase
VPAEPLLVMADRRALHQIVLNLAGNAVKFTVAGRVVLSARAGPPGEVVLEVSDTGVGISPEDQVHLFGAFRQVGERRAVAGEGTGLGLHLSRRLAELMGGRIGVASVPGQGSIFTLHLPAPPPGALAAPAAPVAEA